MAGHQKGRWLPLWKKLRYYLVATAVLVAAGVGFFVFLRRILLVNYQSLETSMAQNYAAEVEGAGRAVSKLGGRLLPAADYAIPGAGVVHRVIGIEKIAPTPGNFPRRWANMQKKPL